MKRMNSVFTSAAFICLSLLIVVLGFRIHQLKELVDEIRPRPRVGEWVPTYPASTLDGSPVTLGDPQGRLQVFYLFSPACPVCKEMESQIAAIHQRIVDSGELVEMYGVSAVPADMLRGYVAEGRSRYPVVQLESRKMVSLMQVHSVPTMIVVDREGIVQWAHVGPVDDAVEQTLDAILSIEQPHLLHGDN